MNLISNFAQNIAPMNFINCFTISKIHQAIPSQVSDEKIQLQIFEEFLSLENVLEFDLLYGKCQGCGWW